MGRRRWARYSRGNTQIIPLPFEWLEPLAAERILEMIPTANTTHQVVEKLCREARLEPGPYGVMQLQHPWNSGECTHPVGALVLAHGKEGPLFAATLGPEEPPTEDFTLAGSGLVNAPSFIRWLRAVYATDQAQAWHLIATAWPRIPAGVLLAILTEQTVAEKPDGNVLTVTVSR